MKRLKSLLLAVAVAALVAPTIGCGIGSTEPENRRIVQRVAEYDTRMLVDDISLFAQTKRPFRGSRYLLD
jgi:hypothetical protein